MRNLRRLACILALSATPALAQPLPQSDALAQRAEKVIVARLATPGDAQFRNIHTATLDGQTIVCGEYTSDKASADYVAYNMFIYDPTHLKGVLHFAGAGRGIGVDLWSEDGRHDVKADARKVAGDYEQLTATTMDYIPACISQS